MKYKKYDVITFEDEQKVVVLSTLNHEGNTYLYVDKLKEDESDTLDKYHILRVCEEGYLQKETDTNILSEILPLLNKKVKEEYRY